LISAPLVPTVMESECSMLTPFFNERFLPSQPIGSEKETTNQKTLLYLALPKTLFQMNQPETETK